MLFCRNIHVHLSLEASETEGVIYPVKALISLISTPSPQREIQSCKQLPVVNLKTCKLLIVKSTFICEIPPRCICLISVFSTQVGSGQTPGELLTPLVLNSILSKALQYSLHGDSPLAANFTFALRFLPETFHPHAPDSLNCLELRYKVRLHFGGTSNTSSTFTLACWSRGKWQLERDFWQTALGVITHLNGSPLKDWLGLCLWGDMSCD